MNTAGKLPAVPACRSVAMLLVSMEILLILLLAASCGGRLWWVFDIAANLRVQWFVVSIVTCATAAWLRSPWHLGISLCLAVACGVTLRSGWLAADAVPLPPGNSAPRIRVCVCNAYVGNQRWDDIAAAVREHDPDVIGILEVTDELSRCSVKQLEADYPHSVVEPREPGHFGIALFSKHPLRETQVFELNASWIPSIETVVLLPDGPVQVVVTHTLPPMGQGAYLHRNKHLQLLAERVRSGEQEDNLPVLVIGDLNLTPWSPCFDIWLEESGLQNASAGHGWSATWYRFNWPLCGLMLDHACCSATLSCVERRVSGPFGSDHRAVTFDFVRTPRREP